MISDDLLDAFSKGEDFARISETEEMVKELLALRKAAACQHLWDTIKLVECGGNYQYGQYCTLCGAKKAAS